MAQKYEQDTPLAKPVEVDSHRERAEEEVRKLIQDLGFSTSSSDQNYYVLQIGWTAVNTNDGHFATTFARMCTAPESITRSPWYQPCHGGRGAGVMDWSRLTKSGLGVVGILGTVKESDFPKFKADYEEFYYNTPVHLTGPHRGCLGKSDAVLYKLRLGGWRIDTESTKVWY